MPDVLNPGIRACNACCSASSCPWPASRLSIHYQSTPQHSGRTGRSPSFVGVGPRHPPSAAIPTAMSPNRLKRKRKAIDCPWAVLLTLCSILTINAFTAPLTSVSFRRESTGMHAKLIGRDYNKNLTLVFPTELDRRLGVSDVRNEVLIKRSPPSPSEFDVVDEGEIQEPEHSYHDPLSESSIGGGANEGGNSSSPLEGGDESSFEKFALQNDLVTASDRLLRSLDTTSSSYTPRPGKSFSDLARLSKSHHSLLPRRPT
ncbi:hypothetical protein THAOC_31521 [Thalassiosira oceanica]|uniref:Uncharacterized protein n=1 Tax=Thalassiosira oceanica TaxID=159749 RepID=K0R934_THAOC|nr:hypothetical protein THAOC_31521 [Thalassiosira oceanica]|eukprot:EJK49585.1 hypothetical protein THAOC_31521 [Thalassiosira oceanica]